MQLIEIESFEAIFGWEHIARYSDLSRKTISNCLTVSGYT
jgi:Flp pilus assembly protein protease CpaA